jgi:hypothetical protein
MIIEDAAKIAARCIGDGMGDTDTARMVAEALVAAVAAERERVAVFVEGLAPGYCIEAKGVAAAIRGNG